MGRSFGGPFLTEQFHFYLRRSFEISGVPLGDGFPCDLAFDNGRIDLKFQGRTYIFSFEDRDRLLGPNDPRVSLSMLAAGTNESLRKEVGVAISANYDLMSKGDRARFRSVFGYPPGRPVNNPGTAIEPVSRFLMSYERMAVGDERYSGILTDVPLVSIPLGKKGKEVSEKLYRAVKKDFIIPVHAASFWAYHQQGEQSSSGA